VAVSILVGPGHRVGTYQLLSELGAGGTAVVYLARAMHPRPDGRADLAVLKMLRPELEQEPELVTMFVEEAQLARQLRHPNVVETREAFEAQGHRFIVMEYLEGHPLNMVQQGPERLGRLVHLRIIAEALTGLAYAHTASGADGRPLGVVHRDISPHNVFVGFDGQVKILDFGIARSAIRSGRTETGIVKGKFRYMAPEQFVGASIDRRADIFSFGIMIWEAVTGERIWGKLSDAQIMSRLLSGAIPPLSDFCDDVSPELEAVCARALSVDPDDRHASCGELKEELDRAIAILGASTDASGDVATAMGTLFPGERERRELRVREQIGEQDAAKAAPPAGASLPAGSAAPEAADTSQAAVSSITQVPVASPRRGRYLLANLAGLTLILLTLGWRYGGEDASPSGTASPSRPIVLGASSSSGSRPRSSPRGEAEAERAPVAPPPRTTPQPKGSGRGGASPASPPTTSTSEPVTGSPPKPIGADLDRENPWK
jgi:serine/threonine protein kinase